MIHLLCVILPSGVQEGESPPGKARSPPLAVKGARADRLTLRHRGSEVSHSSKPPGHLKCRLPQVSLKCDDSTLHAHSTAQEAGPVLLYGSLV